MPAVKVPTGNKNNGQGTGTTDLSLLLIASKSLGRAQMDLNAGWTHRSGDEKGGVFKSIDGGRTWNKLTNGLPKLMGRIGVRVAPSNPNVVYVIVESKDGTLYHGRVLDYVQKGGTMIVQYNVASGGFGGASARVLDKIGPYPMQITSDRVTVETAPLKPTKPDQFLLQAPNRITDRDYEGWVQERGLYFARTWDSHYTPLWETSDPGEKPT